MLLSQAPAYFKTRRQKLMAAHPDSVFIFPASSELIRNGDVHFSFRQESNLYYLTGFDEPESALVLAKGKSYLFVRKRDAEKEMWEGERYGIEGAVKVFGIDEAFLIEDFEKKMPELLKGTEHVFYRLGMCESQDRRVMAVLDQFRRSQGRSGKSLVAIADPNQVVGEMRLFKSPEEAALLRKACDITSGGHRFLMENVKPGMNEFEVEAMTDYFFRKSGCKRNGYDSIVAGGKNATCLHYRSNNEVLRDGELLLVDAGGEFEYYTSDITRTFPIGKKFAPAQAKAYELVLKSQKEAVAMVKPGMTLPKIHQHVLEVLTEGFLSLGLLKGNAAELIKEAKHRRFYPHNTSHWLGMDVHDVGLYQINGEPRPFEAGMCFTIEPGFYVQPSDTDGTADFRNIGIRIEDDILVTSSGFENLTAAAPKDLAEIEALRARAY